MEVEGKASATTDSVPRHLPPSHLAQADWDEVFQEKEPGSFWVSFRPSVEEKALYDDVKVSRQGSAVTFDCAQLTASVEWRKRQLTLAPSSQSENKGVLQAPSSTWKQIHPNQRVLSMDVAPGGELGVSGGSDSTVRVWHTKDGLMRRDLQGHVGEINLVKWFPSGKVILTGAQDLRLKIWDVMTGHCAATLQGHSGAVTGAVMIDRGRNLISTSRDGTALLWDVPTQQPISRYGYIAADNAANACSLLAGPRPAWCPSGDDQQEPSSPVLLVAKEEGSMVGWDVRSKRELFKWKANEALNCCLVADDDVWAGGQDGTILRWDLRTQSLVETIQRSRAPILSLAMRRDAWTPTLASTEVPLSTEPAPPPADGTATEAVAPRPPVPQEKTLWVGTGDGLCFEWGVDDKRVHRDLTGSDCDHINSVVVLNDSAFVACGDGTIRKYKTLW